MTTDRAPAETRFRRRTGRRWLLAAMAAVAGIALLGATSRPAAAASPGVTPIRIPNQAVYDLAGAFDETARTQAESLADMIGDLADADVVIVAESFDGGQTEAAAIARASELRAAMAIGSGRTGGGLMLYFGVDPSGCDGQVQLAADPAFASGVLSNEAGRAIVDNDIRPLLANCDPDSAVLVALGRIATIAFGLDSGTGSGGSKPLDDGPPAPQPGPPFPDPTTDVAVYDTATIFRPETIAAAERTIDAIEARTGAEVVVYSQLVEDGRSTETADADARALMDEWGVGRKGFDDGLVILFDMYPGREHGQVILYGGPGFRATFLDNTEKQRIFEDDMLPRLRAGDLDGALLVALERVDAAATPEHAATLERARQLDAAVGLVGAPLALVVLVGSATLAWRRYGRDPVYLDDPSIHMAGPPESLTPAAAVFVLNGGPSRRALTTALLDVASRGTIAFREESEFLGLKRKVGIDIRPTSSDPVTVAHQRRNAARPLGPAERLAQTRLESLAGADGYIEPDKLLEFGSTVPAFDKALEGEVVARGWFREKPSAAVGRWIARAAIALVVGIIAAFAGLNLPSNGLLLVGIAVVIGAVVIAILARSMPAVSLPGAMIRAMLAAYRRTLKKTMDQARSMDQVVAEAGLTWLETPDQAVVWGTALGLHAEIEDVLGRSLEDQREGRVPAGSVWLPAWYGSSAGGGAGFASGDFAGAGAGSGGLFSSSSVPDLGGMMSALGSIGDSPSSSGSGGGGGFGGGGSGGGGGGSGGGF
jgi:uncharacterized membrane protein YgcG